MQTWHWYDTNPDAAGANVAFSNAFLRRSYPRTIYEEPGCSVGARVETMEPATLVTWRADPVEVRFVFVAAGMVKVTVDGRTFPSGPLTDFVIPPGKECVIDNEYALQAILSVKHFAKNPNRFD